VSNGRVCQKHIQSPVTIYNQCVGCELECLQQQLADRDKTIAELEADAKVYADVMREEQQKNALMLEALEWYADESNHRFCPDEPGADRGQLARDTLAKVKGGDNQ
jgi:hypothetical protein